MYARRLTNDFAWWFSLSLNLGLSALLVPPVVVVPPVRPVGHPLQLIDRVEWETCLGLLRLLPLLLRRLPFPLALVPLGFLLRTWGHYP